MDRVKRWVQEHGLWYKAVARADLESEIATSRSSASDAGRDPEVEDGPAGELQTFRIAPDRDVQVAVGPDGSIAFTCPAPPIREVTFSGGGGKGAAYPGAVAALEEAGVLQGIRVVAGASVGALTAALVAAGLTPEAFAELANDSGLGGKINEGRNLLMALFNGGLSGAGLESLVREAIRKAVQARIEDYLHSGQDDDRVRGVRDKLDRGEPVTFGDLRVMSRVMPEIKELVVAGTLMGDDGRTPGTIEKGKPQLAIFSADTEPDLDIAVAVHASAALPPVFKPVDIKLSSGVTGRFEDGGVMNNTPTSELIGARRSLDPVPAEAKMTFVFQSHTPHQLARGTVEPYSQRRARRVRNRVSDWVAKAPNTAAMYTMKRGLADRPEELVVVPLKFLVPNRTDGPALARAKDYLRFRRTKDYTTTVGGTANFAIPLASKTRLQDLTADETRRHIERRREPQTWRFRSAGQMLHGISGADLAGLARDNYPGAQEALEFRADLANAVAGLEAMAGDGGGLAQPDIQAGLRYLETLAAGDADRLAAVGRALNASGRLDALLDDARAARVTEAVDVLKAGVAVANALRARSHAQIVLREVVHPLRVSVDPEGEDSQILMVMDALLREANAPDEVNQALEIGVEYLGRNPDRLRRRNRRPLAGELRSYRM